MRKLTAMLLTALVLCGLIAVGNKAISANSQQQAVYEYELENDVYADAGSTSNVQQPHYGDVDGSGEVDEDDLWLLHRCLVGRLVQIDVAAADIDDNGKLNNKDLGLLQRYIAGWEVELPTTTTTTTTTTTQPPAPAVILPEKGYSPDKRIKLGDVTLSGQTVTMVIRNVSAAWEPEDGKSYFEYTCYDENGGVLLVDRINFGYIPARSEKICTFDIPEGTVKVELTDFDAEYWSKPV